MTNEEQATRKVATWVVETRTALGLSRAELMKLVESAGGTRASAWWIEQGRATTDELSRVTIALRGALAEAEKRIEVARRQLVTTAVPPATRVAATAAKKPEPKPKIADKSTSLDDLTVAELRKMAAERKLSTVTKSSKKAELVAALDAAAQVDAKS
jgi:hypothetical protein